MSVDLMPETEERIRDWIDSGRFATVSEALAVAVEFLDMYERERELHSALADAEEQTRQGRVTEWTPELHDRLRVQAQERFARGEQPAPHVRP